MVLTWRVLLVSCWGVPASQSCGVPRCARDTGRAGRFGSSSFVFRSSDYLTSNGHLSEDEARKKFWQILSAVEYCHSHHIVHRDLKTENLLLDGNMDIKLAGRGSRCTQEVPSWWGGAAACALCMHTCDATAPAVCTVTSSITCFFVSQTLDLGISTSRESLCPRGVGAPRTRPQKSSRGRSTKAPSWTSG